MRAGALAYLPETPGGAGSGKEAMTMQEREVVFALDIGTRSIVGVLGREDGGRLRVLDIEKEEHGRRAMLDGQIEDIAQVAAIARNVIDRLESRQHIRLQRVCVAAAGRALRSARASFTLEFAEPRQADDETVNQLEAGAVSAAESTISGGDGGFYMVGYTPSQYRLDGYPLSTLHGHRGRVMEVDVVATFLPREVVDSLYAVVGRLGLEVSSLTLEPIASLNAAIPLDIRLLNLVLVDIGAGTSDIAVCRNGSVAGYTMATVAGDEVTELLMKELLVDFRTGEELKMGIGGADPLRYTDILGIVHECTSGQLAELIEPAVRLLAGEIADKVLELNGGPPSAVFLAGGGSKLHGLREATAAALGMDDARVAIAGNHFEKNAFSDEYALGDPEYATPLGIAISAALGMIHDSYVVTLNGTPAKLFRSGTLNVRDVLLMNGCSYSDLMGRTGSNLAYTLNGARQFVRGAAGTPPVLRLNGEEAALSAVVHAGDRIEFQPAKPGANASRTLAEALGAAFAGGVTVNGEPKPLDYEIATGDTVETSGAPQPMPEQEIASRRAAAAEPAPAPEGNRLVRAHATVHTEGKPLEIDVPAVQRIEDRLRTQTAADAPAKTDAPAVKAEAVQMEAAAPESPAKTRANRAAAARKERAARARRGAPAAVPQILPEEPVAGQLSLDAPEQPEGALPEPEIAAPPAVLEPEAAAPAPVEPEPETAAPAPVEPVPETAAPAPVEPKPETDAEPGNAKPDAFAMTIDLQPESEILPILEEPQAGSFSAMADVQPETKALSAAAEPGMRPETPAAAARPAAAEPKEGPVSVTVGGRDSSEPPKRRGIPRVVLPDLPEFTALKQAPAPAGRPLQILLNGEPLTLPPKENGDPYYFMDVLQHSGLDFNHLERAVQLLLNGKPCEFMQKLTDRDEVVIGYRE